MSAMEIDEEWRSRLSDDEEDEENLMDLMPASLRELLGASPSGEEDSRLDKLLFAHNLKNRSSVAQMKYTRRRKSNAGLLEKAKASGANQPRFSAALTSRRRPVTKLKIPVPSWGSETEQIGQRKSDPENAKPLRPRESRSHAGSRRKPVVKLDIKAPDWDCEELIVEEERVNASFVNREEGRLPETTILDSSSPALVDEELVKEYNAARSMFLVTPDFPFQQVASTPTPPPLEVLLINNKGVAHAELSTPVETLRPVKVFEKEVTGQHGSPECQSDVEASVSADSTVVTFPHEVEQIRADLPEAQSHGVEYSSAENESERQQQESTVFQNSASPEVAEAQSAGHRSFSPESHRQESVVQQDRGGSKACRDVDNLQDEPTAFQDGGTLSELQAGAGASSPALLVENESAQQQQEQQQKEDRAVGQENGESSAPVAKKRQRPKRRSREAQASPGLQGGTKWVDGQRRSTRFKSRPLESWRGERLLYARVHSTMVTLIGVKHASPLPAWPKRGQYKYNFKVDSLVSEEHEAKLKLAAYG